MHENTKNNVSILWILGQLEEASFTQNAVKLNRGGGSCKDVIYLLRFQALNASQYYPNNQQFLLIALTS